MKNFNKNIKTMLAVSVVIVGGILKTQAQNYCTIAGNCGGFINVYPAYNYAPASSGLSTIAFAIEGGGANEHYYFSNDKAVFNKPFVVNSSINSTSLTSSSLQINGDSNTTGSLTSSSLQINGNSNTTGSITGASLKINGNITQDNNGSGISWGNNYSKIKDDGNLNILTDNYLYIGKCDASGNKSETATIYADVTSGGFVGIGTEKPTHKLSVNGSVAATDYNVVTGLSLRSMPDYVFENDYKVPTLSETEAYIKANKHLPAFKSAKEMEEKGYSVIDMDRSLLQTVEEMTLHAIAQEKEITILKSEMAAIKALLLKK